MPISSLVRRVTALWMLLLTAAPLAAAFAAPAAGAACTMCASRCRCRPEGDGKGDCRVSAPCAGREPGDAPASPAMRVVLTASPKVVRPVPTVSLPAPSPEARTLRRSAVPPDPPPRSTAA